MGCVVGPNQPPASAVSGNIGIVRAKVVVYDHDPLLARPHQSYSFQMSNTSAEQMNEKPKSVVFQEDSAYLEPRYIKQDMFVGTRNYESSETFIVPGLDLVQDGAVTDRLPGGIIYDTVGFRIGDYPPTAFINNVGKHIFPHQLWLHIGSLLKRGVALHPSEYNKQGDSLAAQNALPSRDVNSPINRDDYFSRWTPEEIEAAPKWAYKHDNDNGVEYFTPSMEVKQTSETVHWTLEKYTPLWQGQDFFVTISKGTKETDDTVDKNTPNEIIDTNWDNYKYLLFDPQVPPPPPFVPGISNEAFYEFPQANNTDQQQSGNDDFATTRRKSLEISRQKYWWKKNTYILIEIGYDDPKHNYFIELVKGRNPRFLHLGEEWDNIYRKGLYAGTDGADNPENFLFMKKCRTLSEYKEVISDELFKQKEIVISVRNHLGKIIVTFGGHEGNPWVIERNDNDPARYDYTTIPVPMVVPCGKMRVHGGNISCAINFAPIKYASEAIINYPDRQMTTVEGTDKDVYMTFSNIGNSFQYTNNRIRATYFRDPRITSGNIGYTSDAYETIEYIQNRQTTIPVYEIFDRQFKAYGRGWVLDYPRDENGDIQTDEAGKNKPPELVNGARLLPHRLSIINTASEGKSFRFGLNNRTDADYPYKEMVSKWDVGVKLRSGSVRYPFLVNEGDEFGLQENDSYTFYHVITPIVSSWKIMMLGGVKPMEGKIDPIDITNLVMSIQDGWSSNNFHSISHEAQLRCYIPLGVPTGSSMPSTDPSQRDIFALGQELLKLHDKSFYLSISYWWENGIGQRDAIGNEISRTGPPKESDLLIQMTGVAYGAALERSANKLIMSFTVKDYMSIFEKQFIFNSPFFDAVSDVVAVHELGKMAGFDDDVRPKRGIDRRPLGFLQKVIKDNGHTPSGEFKHNGEKSISRVFNLKGSFADLLNPASKFGNGETYDSALRTIAAQGGKTVYFDRWGVLKLEDNPALQAAFQSSQEEDFKPLFQFVTSPFPIEDQSDGQPNFFTFDPNQHASHLVYNVVRYQRDVEDAINQIVIVSASNQEKLPDGTEVAGLVMKGYTFFEQILDPRAEGFFGFKKPFYQSDGIFGSEQGVSKTLSHYAKFKFPPITVSFETFGIPGLKALDIISLDNNLYFINDISHEIDPSNNSWWCTLSCSWFKPFRDTLGFMKEPAEQQGGEDEEGTGTA